MTAQGDVISVEPRFRIRCGAGPIFGPGKIELLEQVAKTGSITKAAKAMGMSYMRAWVLVKSLERGFAEPLVRKLRGGNLRGGAELTDTGRELLRLYRELETRAAKAAEKMQPQFASLLKSRST